MSNQNENVSLNVTMKKSTIKTFVVLALSVVLGGLAMWFIHAALYLPLYVGENVSGFIFIWAIFIVAPIVLALSVSEILFNFIKATFKRFMLSSGVVMLAVGTYLNLNFFTNMDNDNFWLFGDADFNTSIFYSVLIHLAYAAVIFGLSTLIYAMILKIRKNKSTKTTA